MITVTRYHDFSAGHRVYGHESKCAHLHGHNYRVHFELKPIPGGDLDGIGRVIDFSIIKSLLCEWLEQEWDHKFLIFHEDPMMGALVQADPDGVVITQFNPTAENMALHLLNTVAPTLLAGTFTEVASIRIDETRKCSAIVY